MVCCFLYFPFSLLVSRFFIANPPQRIVSNDIFACSPLWFVKRKCYIWKLLIVAGKAMCHTYDSHLVEYINLLCGRNGAQLFTKLLQCSGDICWKSIDWMWLEIGASDNAIRHISHWKLSYCLNCKRIVHTWYLSRAPRACSCKFFLAGVNFYRFNAKNWHFRQILREKVVFFLQI